MRIYRQRHLNGKTPVLGYTYNGSQYFHPGEMRKFIDFGCGLQSHGSGGNRPDICLEHNSVHVGKDGVAGITFTLPAGWYNVRVLANTVWNQREIPAEKLLYQILTVDGAYYLTPPSSVMNNTGELKQAVKVLVGDDGLMKMQFGVETNGTWYCVPLNVIEIEEVNV
ncbi:hypothetical protein [Bacteroides fluxus]|uniref:hypothetical protein n=1 Tax=Bacteroides fluxus TaxID=626930 RepID=UPI0023A81BE9|nr:hypothetical protein [Bacteroides fluxus]MDY3788806.1 hypothetical protein [Bacteroides fluxus]MDY4777641.1 hypothetical protein [Phocaeicola vulgatus]